MEYIGELSEELALENRCFEWKIVFLTNTDFSILANLSNRKYRFYKKSIKTD